MKASWVAVVVLLWTGWVDARPAEQLPKDAVRVEDQDVAKARKSVATQARLRSLQHEKAAAMIGSLCTDADALSAESALSQWLDELGGEPDLGSADKAALAMLSRCHERVFAVHPESAGQWWVPVFPLGARAEALLALDIDRDQARRLAAAWSNRQAHKQQAGASERTVRLAVSVLDPHARAALAAEPALLPAAALVPLAQLTYSAALFDAVLQRASDADLAPAMAALVAQLPAPAIADWLQRASQRPALASTAVLTAGTRIADPAIAAWVRAQLDSEVTGASAAQVLSEHLSLDLWLEMAADSQLPPRRRQHAVLAIRLRNDARGELRLRELALSGRLPDGLAAEFLR